MERLNYFNPYDSKSSTHEDQLSRAYLVLLKHSFHALTMFFDYCKKQQGSLNDSEPDLYLHELLDGDWQIGTQKGNPIIDTQWLFSVLLTDAPVTSGFDSVEASDRNARYDGIIRFGKTLSIIIENKPRSQNIWFDQLNPSKQNLSSDTHIFKNASCLKWEGIIKQLNQVQNLSTIAGYEKIMIEDFLSFIDQNFSYLNPFDRFDLCKNNGELLQRRIQNALKTIVKNEELIKYHQGWGFYITTPYSELTKIGLVLEFEADGKWHLDLSFNFAEIQSQARQFYHSTPSIANIVNDDRWHYRTNFHIAYMSTNLLWIGSSINEQEYINFWSNNIDQIYRHSKEEIPAFFNRLSEAGVLEISDDINVRMDDMFFNTNRQELNICPGFVAVYSIAANTAETLDKNGSFEREIRNAIQQGLSIIHKDGSEFLKL